MSTLQLPPCPNCADCKPVIRFAFTTPPDVKSDATYCTRLTPAVVAYIQCPDGVQPGQQMKFVFESSKMDLISGYQAIESGFKINYVVEREPLQKENERESTSEQVCVASTTPETRQRQQNYIAVSVPERDLFLENEDVGSLVMPGEIIFAATLGHDIPQESHNNLPAVLETAHVEASPSRRTRSKLKATDNNNNLMKQKAASPSLFEVVTGSASKPSLESLEDDSSKNDSGSKIPSPSSNKKVAKNKNTTPSSESIRPELASKAKGKAAPSPSSKKKKAAKNKNTASSSKSIRPEVASKAKGKVAPSPSSNKKKAANNKNTTPSSKSIHPEIASKAKGKAAPSPSLNKKKAANNNKLTSSKSVRNEVASKVKRKAAPSPSSNKKKAAKKQNTTPSSESVCHDISSPGEVHFGSLAEDNNNNTMLSIDSHVLLKAEQEINEASKDPFDTNDSDICIYCGEAPCDWQRFGDLIITGARSAYPHVAGDKTVPCNIVPTATKIVRKHCYKLYMYQRYGHLGKGNHMITPKCVGDKIRHFFPAYGNA